ncbi:MAG: DNA cytosine methyltransferase, partial [Synechococcus sp. SB0677_bin_5]|nr:DNA cytosine methyltransferase [Synechococcus sp. SB0677_bin_5]
TSLLLLSHIPSPFPRLSLGYELHVAILNVVNYHVPQDRKRVILVGVPQGTRYTFPTRNHV